MSCATHGESEHDVPLGRMLRNLSWPRSPGLDGKMRMCFEDFQPETSLLPSKRARSHGELHSLWKKAGAQLHLTPSASTEKVSAPKLRTAMFVMGLIVVGVLGFDPLGLQAQGSSSPQVGSQDLSLEGARSGSFQSLRRMRSSKMSQDLDVAADRKPRRRNANKNDGLVELMVPGLFVPVRTALNLSLWNPLGVVYNDRDHPLGAYARKTYKKRQHTSPDQMQKV